MWYGCLNRGSISGTLVPQAGYALKSNRCTTLTDLEEPRPVLPGWPGSEHRPSVGAAYDSSELASSTGRRVFEFIEGHPGTHLREISRGLGIATGDTQYHLHRLELAGRISSFRRGLYRFYYPSTLFGERQRDILSVLTLDTPRELLLSLVERPGASQAELARAVALTPATVSWHMKRLVDIGIVEREQSGRTVRYQVPGGGSDVARFVRTYHPTVWERWSSRLADMVLAFSKEAEAE